VISCDVSKINGKLHSVHSFIYGANKDADRRGLWQHLEWVKNHIGMRPWLLSGDSNVVCSSQEKWGHDLLDGYESDFVEYINQNYWVGHPNFLRWVAQGWNIEAEGVPMFCLYSKLKAVKKILKMVNLEVYGGITQKVLTQAKARLAQAQSDFIASDGRYEYLLREKYNVYMNIPQFVMLRNLKQKDRKKWLTPGHQNKGYFHRMLKVQNSRNQSSHLWDEKGAKVEGSQ
jgi:hypothetical protein